MRTKFPFSTAQVHANKFQDLMDPVTMTPTITFIRDLSVRRTWRMVEQMMALTTPDWRRSLNLLPHLLLVIIGQVVEIRRKRDPTILRLQKTMAPQILMDK